MDFLLSFRLFGGPVKPKTISEPLNLRTNRSTFLVKFALLSVENTQWKYLQVAGVFFRYIITTYVIALGSLDRGMSKIDNLTMFFDIFYAIDLASAILYRWWWPNGKKDLRKNSPPLAKLVWKNKLYKPRKIAMIIVDVISLIPFRPIILLMPSPEVSQYISFLPTLRVYRIPYMYVEMFKKISLRVNDMYELFVKFGMFWLLLTHSITCLWYTFTKEFKDFRAFTLFRTLSYAQNDPFEQYLTIFYFVQIGFANIGFGDIVPTTAWERVFVTVTISLGFIMFCGYLIAGLSSVLREKARRMTNLSFRLNLMKAELDQRKVLESVSEKLLRFYRSLWVTRRGIGADNNLLATLPEAFANSVYYDIFSQALDASLLFRSCDYFCKRAISTQMEINLYMAGDVILKRAEVNSKMFFIRKGTIQIMSYQDDETQVMTFGAGSVFGQIALLLSLPAKSEISAATFCEIYILKRRNLFKVLGDYPKAKDIVLNAHKNLLLNVLADKFAPDSGSQTIKSENVLTVDSFYKVPIEASKLAPDDICVVNTCPYIYVPDTIFMKVWGITVSIIIVVICFYYPYCAVFTRRYPEDIEALIIIVDMILAFNIYLNFSTAFIKENILFSSMREVALSKIVMPSTYIDVAAVMPIHYFLNNNTRIKPVLLCLRCLEFYKIPILFRTAEYTIGMTIIYYLHPLKYVLYFLFGSYAIGLFYYMQACYYSQCNPQSWYHNTEVAQSTDSPVWLSMYFAILIISGTGFGDITVASIKDITYVIVFCLIGVLLFIYLISEYCANLSLTREPRQKFYELAERVNSFLISHKMLSSERIRVRQFLNLQWESNMGFEFTSEVDLFYDTPKHLWKEANQFTRSRGFQNLELYKGFGDATFRTMLTYSYRKVFPPHEVVIYAGERCNSLVILEEGYCEVTFGKDASEKKILSPGQDICTVEVLLGLTSMCHVRTLTHCIIIKVDKKRLGRAFGLNPIAAKELEEYIAEFKKNPVVQELMETPPTRLHLKVRSSVQKSVVRFRYYRKQGGNNELREPFAKLGICHWLRYLLRGVTVLPYGKLLKHWEISRCVFAYCSALVFPLLPYFELQNPIMFYLGFFLDIMAWCDVYFRFHVCYYNKRKILVTHPLWTCGHYIKGSFVLDFIFCFPFDRIMFRPVYDAEDMALVSEQPIDFLRLLRVGQIYRVPAAVNNQGADFLSKPNLFWILLMMTMLTMVFLNLLTSVIVLYCVNYKSDRSGTHYEIVIRDGFENHIRDCLKIFEFSTEPILVFIVHFYWVVITSFGVGFGDITATTTELMIYVILVIVVSYLYFNYVTVIVASYLSSINVNLTIYQKWMTNLINYLKEEKVEPLLRQHIINHFEYIWKKSKGMKAQSVFVNFNLALKDDVMLHLYEDTLKGVPAFAKMSPSFFRILSSHLHEINFIVGAGIYKNGDILSDLYIIHQGEVTLVGNNEDETIILGPSMVFGHLENVRRGKAEVSAVATKNVTILRITTVELYVLLADINLVVNSRGNEIEKFKQALMDTRSGQTNSTEEKFTSAKGIDWFIRQSFKYSKHISMVYVLLSLFSSNYVTYNLAFLNENIFVLATIYIPTEILFAVKIGLGFTTGFVDDTGELVSDVRRIKARYLRVTGFYLDLFTLIPFECLSFAWPSDRLYIGAWLSMGKILRLYHVWYFFNMKFDTLNVNMVFLKVIAMGIWTATLLHQCCCIWYLVSCPRAHCPDSKTWNGVTEGEFRSTYITCLYYVVAVITTTGFGDITPHYLIEIVYTVVLAFVAFFYTALFIGQMVSTAENSLFAKTHYEFEVEGLKTFMHVNDVSHDIQKKTLKYIVNLWGNEHGQQIPELLVNAPAYMTNEIKFSTYGHHINENPILRTCNPFFRKQLIYTLSRTVYFPDDVIVYAGEVNRTAYFVHAGLVESTGHDKNDRIVIRTHEKNSFFGLREGIRPREPHRKTYCAKTCSIILSLELKKWSFLSEFYPDDIKYVLEQTKSSR